MVEYWHWCELTVVDKYLAVELANWDEASIENAFYRDLAFGAFCGVCFMFLTNTLSHMRGRH